jgi:hypothetical protein
MYLDRIDTMLVRWFPQRAAVGTLLFHKPKPITMEEKVGLDHGVGHPLLFLCTTKAPSYQKNNVLKHLDNYSEWPKVANAVIEARKSMTTTATHHEQGNTPAGTLLVAFARREKTWKLGFTTGHGQQPRERTVTARHQERGLDEIAQATRRVSLPDTAPVVRGYEAGREGCGRHRFVQGQGITNPVVDSSAIEVNRRRRRAKSAGLDVHKVLSMLMRSAQGERQVW